MSPDNVLNEDYDGINNDFDDEEDIEGNDDNESGQEFNPNKKPTVKKNSLRARKKVNYNEELG